MSDKLTSRFFYTCVAQILCIYPEYKVFTYFDFFKFFCAHIKTMCRYNYLAKQLNSVIHCATLLALNNLQQMNRLSTRPDLYSEHNMKYQVTTIFDRRI